MNTDRKSLVPSIEKCSSPIGDGNNIVHNTVFNMPDRIEKCSSPIGDGNALPLKHHSHYHSIEKCSSPIGDGNFHSFTHRTLHDIEKCSSPIGDGNL